MKILNVTQGTQEWKQARLGIPTASQASKLITPKTLQPSSQADKYLAELLYEWIFQVPADERYSQFMERGNALETEARDWYNVEYGTGYRPAGLILTDDGRFGASPDGIADATEWDGFAKPGRGLEIKCVAPTKHLWYILHPEEFEADHRAQVQASLWASGFESWTMLAYHPSLKPVHFRVEPDPDFAKAWESILHTFQMNLESYKRDLAEYAPTPVTRFDPSDLPADAATILEHPIFAPTDGLPF